MSLKELVFGKEKQSIAQTLLNVFILSLGTIVVAGSIRVLQFVCDVIAA